MDRLDILSASCKQVLIAADQLIHTLIGFSIALLSFLRIIRLIAKLWYADETLSSHCWRWSISGKRDWPRAVVDTLFFWESNHCMESYESERLRLQLPPELRSM